MFSTRCALDGCGVTVHIMLCTQKSPPPTIWQGGLSKLFDIVVQGLQTL